MTPINDLQAKSFAPATPVVLTATTAVDVSGSAAANDKALLGITILLNATAVTVTVAGFANEDGTAKSVVFTGSTTADTTIDFGKEGVLNTKGTLQVTASVADKVIVITKSA